MTINQAKGKMGARKKVGEIIEEYKERTKNDTPKKIKDLDIKTVGSYTKFGPPVGYFTSPRTVPIDSERFVVDTSSDQIERKPQINETKNINKKFERKNMYKNIEMSSGNDIIYGIDEIGSIYGLYGRDSEIYNAMAEGKVVSSMIEESMKKNLEAGNDEIAKREESLLARCLKREKEKGFEL